MSDDEKNERNEVAEAIEKAAAAVGDDATLQISAAELAAIRQSASNPKITPDMIKEKVAREKELAAQKAQGSLEETTSPGAQKSNTLIPPDNENDATASVDRSELAAFLEDHGAGVGTADTAEQAPPAGHDERSDAEFAGEGLGEFSDADLRAVVFGDGDPVEEETTAVPIPDDIRKFAPDDEGDAEETTAVPIPGDMREFAPDDDDEPAPPSSGAETLDEVTPEPAPAPHASAHPSTDVDEPVSTTFRSTESTLLLVGGVVVGLGMIAGGITYFVSPETLPSVHPVVAGMSAVIGVLFLLGAFISWRGR